MKVISLVKISSDLLKIVAKYGITTNDTKYISLYNDYQTLKNKKKLKYEYITEKLAEKYNISSAYVKRLIHKYEQVIDDNIL